MNNQGSKLEDFPANERLTFSAATMEAIEYLKQASNTCSLAGVIRDALVIYRWAARTVQQGGIIVVMNRKGALKKVVLPQLERTASAMPALAAQSKLITGIRPGRLREGAADRRR